VGGPAAARAVVPMTDRRLTTLHNHNNYVSVYFVSSYERFACWGCAF